MKNQIYPCLWFDGQARAAAEFYCSVFKNAKITADTPMVVTFEILGKKIMGLNGGPMFKINPAISLFVLCESVEEANRVWDKLIAGGKAMIPIDKQPWSERYGWVEDQFGMTWQISVVEKAGDKARMIPSMLFTGDKFGKAEEAMKFYTSVFENSAVDVIIPYPNEDENAGKVMYGEFKLDQYQIAAMDGPGEHHFTFNEGVSLVVPCDSQKEIDFFWNKLTQGGEESMCGWLKDKYGISWQIVPSNIGKLMSDPQKSQRVMPEILKMKKINMEVLENA
jgi:predicted 3-demethylubiquinone-9 3-methyltransferase (glyoxalase superfamily)